MSSPAPFSLLKLGLIALVLGIVGMALLQGSRLLFEERASEAALVENKQLPVPSGPTAALSSDSDAVASGGPASTQSNAAASLPANAVDELVTSVLAKATAVPGEAVLTFRDAAELAKFMRLASQYGLKLLGTVTGLNAARVGFDDAQKLKNYLTAAGPKAPSLEANLYHMVPRIPRQDEQNQGGNVPVGAKFLEAVNATGDRTAWGNGVTVAVLDTGVLAHPTFGKDQVTHVDLVNDGKPWHSHGTSVASLIAGQDERVPGISPGAKILDVRVANEQGFSVSSVLAQGVIEAMNRGAQVINISMGGAEPSALLQQAINQAIQRGIIVVAAAGNESLDTLAYPAGYPGVISISSVDGNNRQASFSNGGNQKGFAAPSVGLPTAWDTDKMAQVSGTSQAAAIGSGIAAFGVSQGSTSILPTLTQSAKPVNAPTSAVGKGVIQVPNAWKH